MKRRRNSSVGVVVGEAGGRGGGRGTSYLCVSDELPFDWLSSDIDCPLLLV